VAFPQIVRIRSKFDEQFLFIELTFIYRRGVDMEIGVVFQIAAVGILIAVLTQVLQKADRSDQAMLTSLAGLILVLFWIIQYVSQLFETVRELFSL